MQKSVTFDQPNASFLNKSTITFLMIPNSSIHEELNADLSTLKKLGNILFKSKTKEEPSE